MTENYLYSLSKPNIENLINELDTKGKNNPEMSGYEPLVGNKKGSTQYLEVIDARARLATLNNKEDLDEISERLTEIENSLSGSSNYVSAGKTFVRDPDLVRCTGYVAHGNGYTVYVSSHINYSKDGEHFEQVLEDDGLPEGMTAVGFDWDTRYFRYAKMAFTDGAFFFYSVHYGIIVWTSDFKTFTKIDGFESTSAILLPDEDHAIVIEGNNKNVYSLSKNGLTLLGTANILPEVNNLDTDEVLAKFNNNNYYSISNGDLYTSTDLVNYTKVTVTDGNKTLSDIGRYYIIKAEKPNENDILVASNEEDAAFTSDGEAWTFITLPDLGQGRHVYCSSPISIKRINDSGNISYYAIIQSRQNNVFGNGIYKWSSLTEEPTCIYHVKQNKAPANLSIDIYLTSNIIKKANNRIYFIDKLNSSSSSYRTIFEISSKGLTIATSLLMPITNYGVSMLTYNAMYGAGSGPGNNLFEINGNLYITSGGDSGNYKQIEVYVPGAN